MTDSSEWELSKENVQPLREGRKIAALTSALQHTPTDLQQIIKDQRNAFEQQIRMYDGDDSLEVWDSYIKWTEQNFPRGGKDGNLLELLQRCLTHFQSHEGYKNDARFVHIWIKFANFSDVPLEIYEYMFDQKIGCGLTLLYEEWANFLERLGNTKKADTIYLEGISRGAQPLDALRVKHSEFQMRVARGLLLQPRQEEEARQTGEEQRTVLGRLKADKKNRVGTTRTGTAKLGKARVLTSSHIAQQQNAGLGFQVFQDENAPVSSTPQQTGERKSVPVKEHFNRENELVPGVWTKARAPQRRGVAAAAATPAVAPAQQAFHIHEDENHKEQQHANAALVDSHVLSARKSEKPGHLLDPIRNVISGYERPMYCKDRVYCGTQEFSFEELRGLRCLEKKKIKQQQEEQEKLAEQLNEMRLMRSQFQKEIESMRAEQKQLIEMQRQLQMNMSREGSGVQPSPMPVAGSSHFQPSQNTPSFSNPLSSAPSASFNAAVSSAPSSSSFTAPVSSAPSSASFSNPQVSALSSVSFSLSADSSMHRQAVAGAPGSGNSSLNSSQRTPMFNISAPNVSSGSSGSRHQQRQSQSSGPTPDHSNTSRQSLSMASPTIHSKEALQMVQGMYNATLECDKINAWAAEDTEMTEAVQPPARSAPVVVFDESAQKSTQPGAIPIFCDENASAQENRQPPPSSSQKSRGLAVCDGRLALQEKPVVPTPAPVQEFPAEDDAMGEGTEFYPHYDMTLAAVGSQDSFAAAARAASTPFAVGRNDGKLPSFPLSSIKPHKMTRNSDEEMTDAASVHASVSEAQKSQHTQFHTFNNTRVTPTKNDLSPIIEGSSEGSSEESKSQAATILGASSTSAAKTPAVQTSLKHQSSASSTSEVQMVPVDSTDKHTIDISHYIPAEMDEKTEALLSLSVCIDPHNPFDEDSIKNFLKRINPPLDQREGYVLCNQLVPNFTGCHFINLGMDTYHLHQMIGEGGYAKVYHADCFNTGADDSMDTMEVSISVPCVIKVQKPAAPWEYYICSELHQRLQKLGLDHMHSCTMEITQGYFYEDGSCLVSDFCPMGSLLNQVNQLKKNREVMANIEPLAAFLTVHLLRIVETLHRCNIIHGDIKPDNILLTGFSPLPPRYNKESVFGAGHECLRLVDFGQAIDMSLYPLGTTFMAKVGTSGFQCIEMMTDQPWTYQTDMFGLAGSLHVLVFGQYMKVYCTQGHWNMTSSFQRKWNVDLWKKLFHLLLNIPDCDQQPDLAGLRHEFEDHFMTNLAPHFNKNLRLIRMVGGSSSH